jgi:dTDP-glucose pyrophosphorylase
MREDISNFTVTDRGSLRDAVEAIDRGVLQIVLVVDSNGVLKGTITDGDVRRGLLRGMSLDGPLVGAMNANPIVCGPQDSLATVLRRVRQSAMRHIPVVDAVGVLIGLELVDTVQDASVKSNWAVLMAGGHGKRLRPLTENIPKPLLAVGGKPILERTLESLAEQGIRKCFISVNYRAELIEAHFGNGAKWGVNVSYLRESQELGTAGALGILPTVPADPILVLNADVMTSVNVSRMFEYHNDMKAAVTIGTFTYDHQVPYGVIQMDGDRVNGIQEKPVIRNFVSAGVYVLSPEVLGLVAINERIDMPDLIHGAIAKGVRICAFPIREYWIDIGEHDDFQRAQRDVTTIFPGNRSA